MSFNDTEFNDFNDTSDNISSAVENEYVHDFLLGGNCHCIIENMKSGNKFEFKIQRNKNKSNMYFVKTMTGLGEIYCGYFYESAGLITYSKGKQGQVDISDERIQALIYTLKNSKRLPAYVMVQHLGNCAYCGRRLEDIESLRSGICPACKVTRIY